jgi:hypothetical protein
MDSSHRAAGQRIPRDRAARVEGLGQARDESPVQAGGAVHIAAAVKIEDVLAHRPRAGPDDEDVAPAGPLHLHRDLVSEPWRLGVVRRPGLGQQALFVRRSSA